MKFTVIGSTGFVGSHLVTYLRKLGFECKAPVRNAPEIFSQPLGHLIYCAGYTADFRTHLIETVDAHVYLLRHMLLEADFDSLLYLSSTRVYQGLFSTQEETPLLVNPHHIEDIYNLSKLLGESLCLHLSRPHLRIVRLSNVYGSQMGRKNFLGSLIHDALEKKAITLKTSLEASKDYIYIDDLLPILIAIALKGEKKIYNVASGYNIKNATIVRHLKSLTGCSVHCLPLPGENSFPQINISQIAHEFDFRPTLFEPKLREIIESA